MSSRSDPELHAIRWNLAQMLALTLSAFAFVSVTYWIHAARWQFIAARGDSLTEPPTISRAISMATIGEPFALWVTASGLCLVVSVAILAVYYSRLYPSMGRPSRALTAVTRIGIPFVVVFQACSAWGMHTLSVNSLDVDRDMHMAGSYVFFIAQGLVILIYAIYNRLLLNDDATLSGLDAAGLLSAIWVRWRFRAATLSLGLVVVYGLFFILKDVLPYETVPIVHETYVIAEKVVIVAYLSVVMMAHADKLRVAVPVSVGDPK